MNKIFYVKIELDYIGCDMTCLVRSTDDMISERSTEIALDHYFSYDRDDGVTVQDIIDRDSVDEQEAESMLIDEITSNMDISHIEYDESIHGDPMQYDWVDFDMNDITPYLRDGKIDKILK